MMATVWNVTAWDCCICGDDPHHPHRWVAGLAGMRHIAVLIDAVQEGNDLIVLILDFH